MTYTTHTTLLARLSEGIDPTAWKEFHDRYLDLIKGFAGRYGLQPADCDDTAQEVFLALTKSMAGFVYDPARGKFRSYLKTVSLRIIFQILRQKRDQKPLGRLEKTYRGAFSDSKVEKMWETEWRRYHMRQAIGRIESEFNDKDRLAFSSYVIRNRSVEETAKKLGLSVDQVYQAKSRIIKRLSQMIAEQIKSEG